MECTRPDISERLIMALYPEDFPEEQEKVLDHVKVCSSCRKELAMLQNLQEAIKEHGGDLADCVLDCPTPADIVDFSLSESPDPTIQRHVEHCCECSQEVDLLKELHRESPSADPSSTLTTEERLIIRNAALKEYGQPPSEPSSSIWSWFRSLPSVLHVPSMALGAVAAALLVVVLVPWTSKEMPSHLVLSDARWESMAPQTMMKGGESLVTPKKVALIILVQEGSGLSMKEAEEIYGKMDLAKRVGDQYELISPDDVKKTLGGRPQKTANVPGATRLVFEKMDVDYVLAFRVGGSGSQINLAGSLFGRPQRKLLGFTSWDGIPKDRLSEKVILIGTELLSGAEQS